MLLSQIATIVDFMRENGVLHYKDGEIDLTLHPSALELGSNELNVETDAPPTSYRSNYEDPMLYPGGQDPVAEQREWLKDQDSKNTDWT